MPTFLYMHVYFQVKQRDNEIAIMIGMLKGRSAGAAGSSQSHAASEGAASTQQQQAGVEAGQQSGVARRSITAGGGEVLSALLDTHLLADRHKAFEVFRKSYKQGEVRGAGWLWCCTAIRVGSLHPLAVGQCTDTCTYICLMPAPGVTWQGCSRHKSNVAVFCICKAWLSHYKQL